MNVDISLAEPVATRVWFDIRSSSLLVEIDGIVAGLDFRLIPEEDFESASPVIKFSLGCEGSVVICYHRDGSESWLPVDMWLPGGFTPPRNGLAQHRQMA
ncbi:MAG: hypothetical protein R3C14_35755 [Caldilineaceae bacterium]